MYPKTEYTARTNFYISLLLLATAFAKEDNGLFDLDCKMHMRRLDLCVCAYRNILTTILVTCMLATLPRDHT